MKRIESSIHPPSCSPYPGELILKDKQNGALLYRPKVINKNKKALFVTITLEAEYYIALLMKRFSHVPEVAKDMTVCRKTAHINPEKGRLLKAVSNAIDLTLDDFPIDDSEPALGTNIHLFFALCKASRFAS
jgi:hypothetical protein